MQNEMKQVTTPLLFKLIPAVVHLGVLLRWFSPEISIEVIISPLYLHKDEYELIWVTSIISLIRFFFNNGFIDWIQGRESPV